MCVCMRVRVCRKRAASHFICSLYPHWMKKMTASGAKKGEAGDARVEFRFISHSAPLGVVRKTMEV